MARQDGVSPQAFDNWCKPADPETREVPLKPDAPRRRVALDVPALKVAPRLDAGPHACGPDGESAEAEGTGAELLWRRAGPARPPSPAPPRPPHRPVDRPGPGLP
ncbi:MAG: hypothetical protein SF028_02215 [Candidatus Sumerlaeia bacterium]|nr:hypothetical protein [Candidatus Sumerlaeia bacterium]